MIISALYALGEEVWRITNRRQEKKVDCPACRGIGRVLLWDKETYSCPVCNGGGIVCTFPGDKIWRVDGPITITTISVHADTGPTEYMSRKSRRSSGYIYQEQNLFATSAEAQAECDRRNVTEEQEDGQPRQQEGE